MLQKALYIDNLSRIKPIGNLVLAAQFRGVDDLETVTRCIGELFDFIRQSFLVVSRRQNKMYLVDVEYIALQRG